MERGSKYLLKFLSSFCIDGGSERFALYALISANLGLDLLTPMIKNQNAVAYTGGGGSSIVKVPGDVPPARVCFFKPSSLAKGILFAKFSPFSLAKGILFANFHSFSLGKGILFGNFGQRNNKLR